MSLFSIFALSIIYFVCPMVYAKFGGENKVYYGVCEIRTVPTIVIAHTFYAFQIPGFPMSATY